jgi:hypothetical protein
VVSGGVSRIRGHGGIGFTLAVHAWRAQATGERDQGCGLARTVGISPCVLHVPASPSDFHLGEGEESDEREEGDEGGSCPSACESGGVQLSVMQGCGSSWRVASATSRADGRTTLLGRLS